MEFVPVPIVIDIIWGYNWEFEKKESKDDMEMQIETYRREFERIHKTIMDVLPIIPEERLYWKPYEHESFLRIYSIGQLIIHIAQIQEYLFNGLSANFWDHPHEWTTREALPHIEQIKVYLGEVAEMRKKTFTGMTDADLDKKVYLPDRTAVLIGELFLRALMHMSHHRGQVYAYIHLFSDKRLPPISDTTDSFKRLI
jgi:uncharacterized damage-inducible protein DinB